MSDFQQQQKFPDILKGKRKKGREEGREKGKKALELSDRESKITLINMSRTLLEKIDSMQ